jgi:hypothetical protein
MVSAPSGSWAGRIQVRKLGSGPFLNKSSMFLLGSTTPALTFQKKNIQWRKRLSIVERSEI